MDSNHRFIMKPKFNNLTKQGLIYKDILTYVAIRSYYNSKDKYCYPSYKTLEKKSGTGPKFISQSIKRLDQAGYLDVWKMGKDRVRHCYKFKEQGVFQKIPYGLLEKSELSSHEKAMLLLLREYCDDVLKCSLSITQIASSTGLSYRTIHKQFKALILKGFIVEEKNEDANSNTIVKEFRLTDKLGWHFKNDIHSLSESQEFNVEAIIAMWTKMKRVNYSNR